MSNPREVAKQLLQKAQEKHVRFPKIWNEQQLVQECGTILMANREGKEFNVDKALDELINKHGTEEPSAATKRAAEEIESKSDGEEEGAKKKKRAAAVYACESNRAVGDAIHEMAAIYFKNKDARKGGVFSKAAKAIRDTDMEITTGKQAMSLKGIGKGIAGYIDEFKENGMIQKLEELRAGIA